MGSNNVQENQKRMDELIHSVLSYLNGHIDRPCILLNGEILPRSRIKLDRSEQIRLLAQLNVLGLIEEKDSYEAGDYCIALSTKGLSILSESGSWLNYRGQEQKGKKKSALQEKLNWVTGIFAIIGVVGTISAPIWVHYRDKKADHAIEALEKANTRIEVLESQVDSLVNVTNQPN